MAILNIYFNNSSFAARFKRFTRPGNFDRGVLFAPAWFTYQQRYDIQQALEDGEIEKHDTKFGYEHLRDHLSQCGIFVSQQYIEITPTVIPTHKLPYFSRSVRRIYMTATLPTKYSTIRTFGLDKPSVIVPKGKAGAAQRLFVFARGENESDKNIYKEVRQLATPRKACIIAPSGEAAEKWKDYGEIYDSKTGNKAILAFKREVNPKKLVLAALYDGIDLPGKSCNVLILDGIPRGLNLHDRFLEETLNIHSFRASNIAAPDNSIYRPHISEQQ